MNTFNAKAHWEHIYQTKPLTAVSWYQPIPQTSLDFILEIPVLPSQSIIDVGGGDSFLVDHLLTAGYTNLTVLDISSTAIERAKNRLGKKAEQIQWEVTDMLNFKPTQLFDLWHDRAAFHFLTESIDIDKYTALVEKGIRTGGHMIIGAFSMDGPKKCSGIPIRQYSAEQLISLFEDNFELIRHRETTHQTPFNTSQSFIFCEFRRK